MPPWGRPPERSMGMGRQRRSVWGPDGAHYGSKLRELGDSGDENPVVRLGRREGGVLLDPSLMKQRGKWFDDDLYYHERLDPRSYMEEELFQEDLAYGDEYALQDEFHDRLDPSLPPGPSLEDQELVLQRALGRIRQARLHGQPDVNLSHEELDALAGGRHYSRYPAASVQAPSSPVGRPSSKVRSRTNTTSSASTSARPKRSSSHTQAIRSNYFTPSPQPSKRGSKSNKRSIPSEYNSTNPSTGPPSFMVSGYGPAPLGYSSRSSPSQPTSRSGSLGSQTRGLGQVNRAASPFDPAYSHGASMRPPSSSRTSYSSAPDDAEFAYSRSGSAVYQPSQAQRVQKQQSFTPYPDLDPFVYQTAGPGPACPMSSGSRRLASGPEPEQVTYASVPRRVSAKASAVSGARVAGGASDPTLGYRMRYGYEDDHLDDGRPGSSGEDDMGDSQQDGQIGVVSKGVGKGAKSDEIRSGTRLGSSGTGSRNKKGKWKRK